MPLRPHRRRPRRARRKRAHRTGWRWLGLGALVVAAAALLRREQQPPPSPEVSEPPPVSEPPAATGSSWIAGPAGTLHVLERHPSGELPVVFVHGLGGRAAHWAAQFDAAGPAIHTVAFDLPGHGLSDPAIDSDYSIPALAAAIGAVLDALGLRRCLLAAHSLGAAAAIEYAASHPKRIAGLLLIDPNGDQSHLPEAQRLELMAQLSRDPEEEIRWYFRQLLTGAPAEVADRVLEDLAAVPSEVLLSALESGASYSPLVALKSISEPVRSLISDLNDLPYSLHHLIPDLPVLRVPQASHWLMLDRPAELWTVLIDFLDEIEARIRPGKPQQHIDKY